MEKEKRSKQKVTQTDIELLFGGFLKLIRKNIEIELHEEKLKEMAGMKQQLNLVSIENEKLKKELKELKNMQRCAETKLGISLEYLLHDK